MRRSLRITWGCLLLSTLVGPTLTVMDAGHIQLPTRSKRCAYSQSYGMLTADCLDCNLKTVPLKLKNNIEVLILTQNRLRDVTEAALSHYTGLRFLYLGDNLITHVDHTAFSALQQLEVVDLSLNALQTVPPSLLALPALRKLYLSHNLLGTLPNTGLEGAPLNHNLEFLTVASCRLTQFPTLDSFLQLKFLNVSGNALGPVRPTKVALMCRLEELDVRQNPGLAADYCSCHVLQTWFDKRGVRLSGDGSLNCPNALGLPGKCDSLAAAELGEAEVVFESCKAAIAERLVLVRTRQTWIWASVALVSVSATTVLLIVTFWVRRRRKLARNAPSAEVAPGDAGGDCQLLGQPEG